MIAILVPVLGRPRNVAPFIESVKNTGSEHRVYFICSPGDKHQILACKAADAETLIAPFGAGSADYAKKINWAFDQTEEEWIFQGADDIRFAPNWDITALEHAKRTHALVIGTNDLGNPDVKRGRHSTHSLIHRSYVEQYGGTVDGSGKVLCELYDHQWCDNEFVRTAMLRKKFAACKTSIVEHLHPHWGKGKVDGTYRKATRRTPSDLLLYKTRMRHVIDCTRVERRARMVR